MCEMCNQHGEGKKWFLRAQNYSDELLRDRHRQTYVRDFFADQQRLIGRPEPMHLFGRLPAPVKAAVRAFVERNLRANHYGQVVTLKEALEVVEMAGTIVRLPCVCRRITLGGEHRYCLGFSLSAIGLTPPGYWNGPDGSGLEQLSRDEARTLLNEYDRKGLVHSVWTFGTPYIGGLCNCDHDGCRAVIGTLDYGIRVLHHGHHAASVTAACRGCKGCLARCPFGALQYDDARRQVTVEKSKCYGCGLCHTACSFGALELAPR